MRKKIISALVVAVASGAVAGPATAAVPDSQQSKFAALRHAPTSNLPTAVNRFLSGSVYRGLGLDASQTRRIAAPGGGSWDVTPGDGYICLYVESEEAGTCGRTADALAGRLTLSFIQPSNDPVKTRLGVPTDTPRFQAGLLPDDVVSTTATSRLDGEAVAARANADGLYRLSSIGGIGTVTMHRAGGRSQKITAATGAKDWAKPKMPVAHAAGPGSDGIPPGHSTNWVYLASGYYGNLGKLDSVNVRSEDTNWICGNAWQLNNTWAGSFFCSNAIWAWASHPYNGVTRRYGWAGAGAPSYSVLGGARESYTDLG